MSINSMISALFVVAIMTNLTVEAIKIVLDNKKYSSNVIAMIVSVILAIFVSVGMIISCEITVTPIVILEIIALAYLSFLSATLGYDKVIQALEQISKMK